MQISDDEGYMHATDASISVMTRPYNDNIKIIYVLSELILNFVYKYLVT